jgi:hypothetical protein
MIHARISRLAKVGSGVALALALMLAVAGCGSNAANSASTNASARESLPVAVSALSTMAPDAKLLVVQTSGAATPTSTPTWSFLFGSPKTDKTFLVEVKAGKVVSASEYGSAGLTAPDWAAVPSTDAWKIDSTDAYKKAVAAKGAKSGESAYSMGFLTYLPSTETSSDTKPFVWYVSFDPSTSGASTSTVQVDAKSGTVLAK